MFTNRQIITMPQKKSMLVVEMAGAMDDLIN